MPWTTECINKPLQWNWRPMGAILTQRRCIKNEAEDADQAAPLKDQVSLPSSQAYSICAWVLTIFLWTSSQNRLHYAYLTLPGQSDTVQAKLSKAIGAVKSTVIMWSTRTINADAQQGKWHSYRKQELSP